MRVVFCVPLLLAIGGCATMDTVKTSAGKIAQAAREHAAAVYQRQQHYLAEHEVLKNFEDASEHSEAEVLKVLRASRNKNVPAAAPATHGSASSAAAGNAVAAATIKGDGSLRWPVEAGVISSDYGARWGKLHKGLDIAADSGEPVYAVADGEVIYAGDGLRGYGNVIILQHADRLSSLYAHNSELKVQQGQHVTQGSLIALMGSTGHSTGPHVHFELRQADVAVNPRALLPVGTLADATAGAARSDAALNARR